MLSIGIMLDINEQDFLKLIRLVENDNTEYIEVILDACLALQNREDLIDGEYYPESLTDLDLYFHPEKRNKIYAELGLDPAKSYYELSKEMGFDLARFYQ